MNESRRITFGFALLRIGLAFVFLWFGFSQLRDPLSWTGYLPEFLQEGTISTLHMVLLNGWFEVLASILLIIGVFTRPLALLLSLHLFGIALSIGVSSAVGVRDVGLAIATLVVMILGPGNYSLEYLLEKRDTVVQ